MKLATVSPCGRFVVLDALYLDRVVFESLSKWADARGLRPQDAIQLAVCAFNEQSHNMDAATTSPIIHSAMGDNSPHVSTTVLTEP